MPRRLVITIMLSALLHVVLFAFLFFLSTRYWQEISTLPSAGGVVWFNLNPGGEGSGGQGGLGAPLQENLSTTPTIPAIKQAEKPKEEDSSLTQKNKAAEIEIFSKKSHHPIPPPPQRPNLEIFPTSQEQASLPRGWKGPGEGDESGNKTGPGQGQGKGLGAGKGSGIGAGEGPGGVGLPGTGGSGSGGEASSVLAKIRDKIYRAKRYPHQARSEGVEGACGLSFEINPDGSLRYVNLNKSCGHPLLDEEALATVRRAAPFPYYAGPIQFTLRFSLKEP
jgi:periplasmic protein TonB